MSGTDNNIIAVFVGQFPKVSNTFIVNEIISLRRFGYVPVLFSMDSGDLYGKSCGYDVHYMKSNNGLFSALLYHLWCIFTKPIKWLHVLSLVAKGGINLKVFVKYLKISYYVQKQFPSVIYCHFLESQAEVATMVSIMLDIPLCVKIHGSDLYCRENVPQTQCMLNTIDKVVVVSNSLKCHIVNTYGVPDKDLYVNYCGINIDKFSCTPVHRNGKSLLFVGRMIKNKGIEVLLHSIAEVKKSGADFHLDLFGDGPDLARFKSVADELGVSDVVSFYGAIDNSELPGRYAQADVFVLPSFCEGMPTVIMEAMSSGLPIIATNVGGIPEMIDSGVEGILVEPGDVGGLAESINRLLISNETRMKMGEAALFKSGIYQIDTQVQRLLAILKGRDMDTPPVDLDTLDRTKVP